MAALTRAMLVRHRRDVLRRFRLRSADDALRFVNWLGFCYAFTGGPGGLPGLFDVLATTDTDRMWSWTWAWKDELATRRLAYYGKVIRRKPSYVALALLPAFYALSGNVGAPDDGEQAYREGRLSLLARALYERILADGPVCTWTLRRRFVARGESGARFHRALDDLQACFLVAKVGEAEEWRNGFIWDAFYRWMPRVVRDASRLRASDAAARVLERYLAIVGAASGRDIAGTFGWELSLVTAAAGRAGLVQATVDGRPVWAHAAVTG